MKNKHCTHRYASHKAQEVPWWACYNRDCEHHDLIKRKNGIWPILPTIAIANAQKCPCLRAGCACNWKKDHPYHEGLIPRGQCSCNNHPVETIRKVNNGAIHSQITVNIQVKGRRTEALILMVERRRRSIRGNKKKVQKRAGGIFDWEKEVIV